MPVRPADPQDRRERYQAPAPTAAAKPAATANIPFFPITASRVELHQAKQAAEPRGANDPTWIRCTRTAFRETGIRPDRFSEDDAKALEALVKRKRAILAEPVTEPPVTPEEIGTWARLLGKAAGDEGLFERKRRDAAARAKLDELEEERRVAKLTRQPLRAAGSVQLPKYAVHDWFVVRAAYVAIGACAMSLCSSRPPGGACDSQ